MWLNEQTSLEVQNWLICEYFWTSPENIQNEDLLLWIGKFSKKFRQLSIEHDDLTIIKKNLYN